jgi:DNA primase
LQEATVRLPKDFTTEIPPNEAVWLYRASISAALARHYGFGYSGSLRRVVLPVYRDNALIGFTARSTINAKPKYIERMATQSGSVFVSDPLLLLPDSGDCVRDAGYDLVLTEDILSAVRVGRIARRTVALLGTSANAEQLAAILKGVRRIAIWLDPDKAGRTAGHKISRTLQLQGFSVQSIRTERDPKYYSNAGIRRILNGQN